MRTLFAIPICLVIFALAPLCSAQEPKADDSPATTAPTAAPTGATTGADDDQEAIHDELRALHKVLVKAVLDKDFDEQLKHATDDIIVTWQHGVVLRGKDSFQKFVKESQASGSEIFQGYKQPPTPTGKTVLYGDNFGIAYGTSIGKYKLLGDEFELPNYWTATLVKQNGQWKIAGYHISANVVDNPLMDIVKGWLYWVGGGGLIFGILIGFILSKMFCKKRAAQAQAQA